MIQIKDLFKIVILFVLLIGGVNGTFAETINVADYGIVPQKDVTIEVNNLMKSIQHKKGVTLFFPKGEYWFYPENAVEQYRSVSNHENGLRRLAFTIQNMEDFTLDGNGSTFMFWGKINPIVIDDSKNITLKNFSIDWDTPFHHELKVIESDEKSNTFVAEVSPKKYGFEVKNNRVLFNHYNWQDEMAQNVAFDPTTLAPIYHSKLYSLRYKGNAKISKVADDEIKFQNGTTKAPPVGTVICNYGAGDDNRHALAMHLTGSENTYIENVTVYAAGGMALMAERCEDIHLNKMVVTSRDDRMMATRADATHFLGCKGLVKLENCLLEKMADDGINVHGAYVNIEKYIGDKTFLCEISHRQQRGLVFTEPGDKVMITSRETVLPLYETTVEKVQILNKDRLLVTMKDVPQKMFEGPLSLENITWYPDVEMRKNTIRNNRARAALISTKGKVLIEDNFFSSQMHGILIEGDNKSWYESGGVRDITIQNNIFENISYGQMTGYPLYISPMLTPEQKLGDKKYHHNIRFNNNKLKSFNGHLVHARSVKGLELIGNVIEKDTKYPVGLQLPVIDLDYCEDIVVEKNEFKNFDWPIELNTKGNTTNLAQKNNIGLEVKTASK